MHHFNDGLNKVLNKKQHMYNSKFIRTFLGNVTYFKCAKLISYTNGDFPWMYFLIACSLRPHVRKGFFSPAITLLEQKLSVLCRVPNHRGRLVFKHTAKMPFPLQRPLRMAFANTNDFAKAKKSSKLHVISQIFLKACLKKVLKEKHRVF